MKKKLLALAVLGSLAAPVFAQSNVQIYGIADAYMQYGKLKGDDTMGIGDGGLLGSRLGFRGQEDLGNGLKAVFLLEEGFDISTGKSAYMSGTDSTANSGSEVFTRQAYVGIKGSFGQVSLGRQYAPGYFSDPYDPLAGGSIGVWATFAGLANLTIAPTSLARWNNSVAYNGTFESVSVAAIYSAGNQESDTGKYAGTNYKKADYSDDDKYGVSLKYDNGPLKLGAIYQGVKFKSRFVSGTGYVENPSGKDKTQNEFLIGASYDFGMLTLLGSYQKGNDVKGIKNLDVDAWQLGAIVPVGPGKIRFSYGQEKIDPDNDHSYKPKAAVLAYTQELSKRTTVYAGYLYTDFDDMTYAWAMADGRTNISLNGHSSTEKIDDTNLVFVGMQHKF
jgi:predicted porin